MSAPVDLLNVTNFERTPSELEEFWLVAVCVAGKNGTTQAKKVHKFLEGLEGDTPFDKIGRLVSAGKLRERLEEVRMGQYGRIERAFACSLNLDLKSCSLKDLQNIPGVGGKTSRFFILHSRRDCEHIVLDTHILRFLREKCGMENVPKSTPSNPSKYAEIEAEAREILRSKFPGKSLAEADLKIWLEMSGRAKKT
jgi:hypothetical protein